MPLWTVAGRLIQASQRKPYSLGMIVVGGDQIRATDLAEMLNDIL
jgi:hypothetical protein